MLRTLWLYGPPIVHAAVLFWLSHQPQLPSTPGGDKTAHVVAYAVLGALVCRALYQGTAWRVAVVGAMSFLVSTLYGLSDEWHQTFVPGRDASAADVLADTAGALLGTLLLLGLARFTRRVRRDTRAGCAPDSS